MKKPEFITFTGIDDATDLIAARSLAAEFPVEYGVLFSPERQGENPRYPAWPTITRLTTSAGPAFRLAAHLCGGYSRLLIAAAPTLLEPLLREHFGRVQVNTAYIGINASAIARWASSISAKPILQCRESFPDQPAVSWLFDASGGHGRLPSSWPSAPAPIGAPVLVGYAGGLKPSNIAEQLPLIAAAAGDSPYWIDMESGVRDADDRLDLGKCRAVCEAVYGVQP